MYVEAGGGGPESCTDYSTSSSLIAWWDMETANARVATGGTCASGSNCDLTDNNTVTLNTTDFQEALGSADFEKDNSEYLSCADATCGELNTDAAFTVMAWVILNTSPAVTANFVSDLTSAGGFVLRTTASENFECRAAGPGTNKTETSGGTITLGTFAHLSCSYDEAGDDEVKVYIDGVIDCSGSCNVMDDAGASTADFTISLGHTTLGWDGEMDEVSVWDVQLTAPEICYVCSCGIENGESCTGNAGDVPGSGGGSAGRNVAECGSCTMANCDATAPT